MGTCGPITASLKGKPYLPQKMKKEDITVHKNWTLIVLKLCDRCNITIISTLNKHEIVVVTKHRKTVNKLK